MGFRVCRAGDARLPSGGPGDDDRGYGGRVCGGASPPLIPRD